ncbi:hypothetical protein [Mesobacillus sp. S13]|uniref:hypothetical protein n=1 Tax=Mesobacillus sp. S13 TaxID=2880221 RepID=UPI001CF521D1|nr:hypothetical protein [Mesobacillus sp. S13]
MKSFNFNTLFLDMNIQDFQNYIEFMEENILRHKKNIEDEFEEKVKELNLTDPEEQQALFEYLYDDQYHADTYKQILRKSLFLSLYSFVETQLKSIAIKLEKKELTKIKLNDISHSGIPQYLFFIETVHNIQIDISKDLRKQFLGYNILRNHFVHNDRFPVNKKKYQTVKLIKGVKIDDSPIHDDKFYIDKITSDFNRIYLEKIQQFFNKLHEALETIDFY